MASPVTPPDVLTGDRVPPNNLEAEQGLLGSMLLDAARVMDLCVTRGLTPGAFYNGPHQVLFDELLAMHEAGRPIDLVTVGDRLSKNNRLETVGGSLYLDRLIDLTPTAAHAEYYLNIVYEKYLLRMVIQRSYAAIDLCFRPGPDAPTLLGTVEQSFFEISDSQRTSITPWPRLVKKEMTEIESILLTKRGLTGVPTGFKDLDNLLPGLQPGDMIVLAARPSMGKTALALNIAENVALGRGGDHVPRPVAIFSLEMSAESLVRRMLCSHARVPSQLISKGIVSNANHGLLMQAADALNKAPIFLDDSAGLEVMELRARARRLKRKHDLQLIVVDYLQLLNYERFNREGRQRETAAISQALKGMAKELKIPVLVLSQLSRAPETRDKLAIPRLSDLRDSGAIEQDADVVCLLRRPCIYKNDEDAEDKTLAVIDVAKHRNGPIGEVRMNFDAEYTRFDDRASGTDHPEASGEAESA